jgi:CHAT domain-containing protein
MFSESSIENISTVNSIFPDYLESDNLSSIHFTKDAFSNWVYKNKLKQTTANSKKSDLQLIAAHASPGDHRVDNAYLDKGYSQLSINNICKRRIQNKLTILAVCDGGNGQSISHGSSFSLASAFLFSGAKSCVYSESKLDDRIGASLITSYLKRLENGEQKDWALRNAKLDYLKKVTSEEGYNPIYWAGLQVMGEVSPVSIGGQSNDWIWFVVLLLLIGIGLVFRQRNKRNTKKV